MNQSESITNLAKALALAQGEIKGALKESVNPHFRSKYADLASVWEAARAPLTKHGLSVVQSPEIAYDERGPLVSVTTMLLHASGEWISGTMSARPAKDDVQLICACTTYLRRYSLSSFASITPEDDDGNTAAGKTTETVQQAEPLPTVISAKQAGLLHGRFRESLPEDLQPKAETLLHDFLAYKEIRTEDGKPSALAIKKSDFERIGREAIAHAKSLSQEEVKS